MRATLIDFIESEKFDDIIRILKNTKAIIEQLARLTVSE